MNLNVAVAGQNSRYRVFVFLVDRRDGLVQVRFRHAGHAHHEREDHELGDEALQARQALARKHGLQFVGRPR